MLFPNKVQKITTIADLTLPPSRSKEMFDLIICDFSYFMLLGMVRHDRHSDFHLKHPIEHHSHTNSSRDRLLRSFFGSPPGLFRIAHNRLFLLPFV